MKRLVRESFRLRRELLNGLDIVVMARTPVNASANALLSRSLEGIWLQAAGTLNSRTS